MVGHRRLATSVHKIGSVNGINIESIVIATLGAIVLVSIGGFFSGSRRGRLRPR
jgi:uncharacterized membrane protein YeaQ/YmgE (transglycosylase-associated protein family)